jgi:hypothetical protein
MFINYADAVSNDAPQHGKCVGYNVYNSDYDSYSEEEFQIKLLKSNIEFNIHDSIWDRTLLEYARYPVENDKKH